VELLKNRIKIHDDWSTPQSLMIDLVDEFGNMFDPCPIRRTFNGLKIEWKDVNFINPHYNRKDKEAFVRKAVEESKKGKVCVCLLPVSTSTKLFHEVIKPNAKEIRFIKGRIKFKGINSKGEKVENKTGQHDSMLVIFK